MISMRTTHIYSYFSAFGDFYKIDKKSFFEDIQSYDAATLFNLYVDSVDKDDNQKLFNVHCYCCYHLDAQQFNQMTVEIKLFLKRHYQVKDISILRHSNFN